MQVAPGLFRPAAVHGIEHHVPLGGQGIDERLLQTGDVVEGDVERSRRGQRAAAAVAVGLLARSAQGRHVVGRRRPVAQHPLQPVDGRRIVRGGDDRTAVGVQPLLGIVDHGRGEQPEVDHVETGLSRARRRNAARNGGVEARTSPPTTNLAIGGSRRPSARPQPA